MRQRKWSAVVATVLAGGVAFGGVLVGAAGTAAAASTATGVTVAGGNGSGSAGNQLATPTDVFVDSTGDVYVADFSNNRVQEWAPGATSGVTVAGGNGAGSAANQLNGPIGVFVDGSGNIYIADFNNNRVQKWAPGATSGVTVAGGNGAGSAANQLNGPGSVFVDSSGDVYVSDGGNPIVLVGNNRVQKWAPGATSGVTVAGGNGAGSAANQLDFPGGVFVDGAGDVYVADQMNERVQEWAPGATSGATVVGGNGAGSAANQLFLSYGPSGVSVDSAGDVFVADSGNNRVQDWAPGSTSGVTVAGGNGAGSAANQLNNPEGVSVDGSGDVYVDDTGNNRVQEWEAGPNGAPSVTIAPQSQTITGGGNVTFSADALGNPLPTVQWQQSTDGGATWSDIAGATSITYGITSVPLSDNGFEFRAVFTNGAGSATTAPATLTVTTATLPTITTQPATQTVSGSGTVSFTAAASGSPTPTVQWQQSTDGGSTWSDIAGAASDTYTTNVVGTDNGFEFRAVFTNPAGSATTGAATLIVDPPVTPITTVAGGNGAGSAANQLNAPIGVVVDSAGDTYVADWGNNRVQEWAPGATSGVTVAGGNGSGSAANQLSTPSGVFVDGSGNVYVSDQGNNRVQEWAPGATSGVTVAGGNGAGSAANQLDQPAGVFVDGAGNVYVADALNNRVQEWAPGATAGVTVAGGNGVGSVANQLDLSIFSGVSVDSAGNVYVTDTFNERVQKWAPGATSGVTVAGGNGSLNTPEGLFVDSAGDVFVADTLSNRVQEWTPGATAGVTVAGLNSACCTAAANQLWEPGGVYVDSAGVIYVADTNNNRVQAWGALPNVAPIVVDSPQSQTVFGTGTVSFSADAGGRPQPTMQWQQSTDGGSTWSDITGATSTTLTIANVPTSDNGFEFRAVFTNSLGSATTNPATLTVNPPVAPAITTQPISQSAPLNFPQVSFTAAASGGPTPTVQWQLSTDGGSTWTNLTNSTTIDGATGTTLQVNFISVAQNGNEFRAVFTNSAGSATTNPATLTVTASPPTTSVGIPSNGATQAGDNWLDAFASAPAGVASVSFEVSGGSITDQVVGSGTSTPVGWIGAWDTTVVPNGTYTLQSVATDFLGQSTTSAPITVTVDNLPLNTTVIIPSNGATLSGSSAVLDAVASGTSAVTSVQFEVSGGSLSNQVVGTATPTIYGWIVLWNTTSVPNGTYTLQSVATEVGGTTATSPGLTVTVTN